MKFFRTLTLVLFLCMSVGVFAQKIKGDPVTCNYVQLPLIPLDDDIKHFTSEVFIPAEALNKKLIEDHKAEVIAREKRYQDNLIWYEKAMKRYEEKKKSAEMTNKLLKTFTNLEVEQEEKPEMPQKPGPLPEPKLHPVPNKENVKAAIKIEGLTEGEENALSIKVLLPGTEFASPNIREKKRNTYVDGETKTFTEYHAIVRYRHVFGVRVKSPSGEVLLEGKIPATEAYTQMKTGTSRVKSDVTAWVGSRQFRDPLSEKITNANIKHLESYLVSNFSVVDRSKTVEFSTVSHKKQDYSDVQLAIQQSKEALSNLRSDPVGSKEKLNLAIGTFQKVLTESDLENKKARINSKVTEAVLFNLAQAAMWAEDFELFDSTVAKLFALKPGRKEKQEINAVKNFKYFYKKRYDANNK